MKISVKSSCRIVVAELHHAGYKSSGIIKETGYDANTVDRIVASLKQDLFQSMAELARKRNVSKVTISEAVRNDLGMKSYCRRRRNIFTAKSKVITKEAACFSTT